MLKFIILSLIFLCFFSCSSVPPSGEKKAQADQLSTEKKVGEGKGPSKVNLLFLENTLNEKVKSALKSGKAGVEFLQGELFLKASYYSMRGKSKLATYYFQALLRLDPNNPFLKKKYAIELIRVGQLEDAKKLLEEVFLKGKYKNTSVGLILAGVLSALGKKETAEGVYEKLLAHSNEKKEACIFLSKSYGSSNKKKKALKVLTKCEKEDPKEPVYSYYQGKLLWGWGDKNQALKQYKKSIKIDPSFSKSVLGAGKYYEEREKYKKALSFYYKHLELRPNNSAVLGRVVQVLFLLGDFIKVIPFAERLTSLDPGNLNLKVRLGILYTDAKRYEDAKGVFREVLQEVPSSDKILFYMGSLSQQTGELEKAIEYYGKVGPGSKLFAESSLQRGNILHDFALGLKGRKKQKIKEAKENFLSYIHSFSKKHPDLKLDLFAILASYYEKKMDFKKAISTIEELRTEKKYNEGHDYYLASLYEKNGKIFRARTIIKAIIKKNPNNPHALNFLGYSYLETNENFDDAYKYIKRAVKLRPNDGYIRDSLGWYYYKIGNYRRALTEIKRAWELVKNDMVITKHLAIVYQELKNYRQANKYFKEALKHCKLESEKIDIRKALANIQKFLDPKEEGRLPASTTGVIPSKKKNH